MASVSPWVAYLRLHNDHYRHSVHQNSPATAERCGLWSSSTGLPVFAGQVTGNRYYGSEDNAPTADHSGGVVYEYRFNLIQSRFSFSVGSNSAF